MSLIALFNRLQQDRGRPIAADGVGTSTIARYLAKRLFPGILKLPYYRMLLRKCGRRFIVGRGARIYFKELLSVGNNCLIGDSSMIDCLSVGGVTLGNNVTIRENAWLQLSSGLSNLGEFVTIGDNVYIGPRSVLGAAGPIVIGEFCQLGSGVNLLAENHRFDQPEVPIHEQGVTRTGISIGKECWLGNNVIVLDGVALGDGCVVGAGSVVTKSFEPGSVIVGNPARVLRRRHEEDPH